MIEPGGGLVERLVPGRVSVFLFFTFAGCWPLFCCTTYTIDTIGTIDTFDAVDSSTLNRSVVPCVDKVCASVHALKNAPVRSNAQCTNCRHTDARTHTHTHAAVPRRYFRCL